MRHLNSKATAIFRQLIDGLDEVGASKKIDNANGAFMAACVEIIGHHEQYGPKAWSVSIAHYYEQNGDLVCDPDMTFQIGADEEIYPTTFEQGGTLYQRAAWFEGGLFVANDRVQHDITDFANDWMTNIAEQQKLGIKKSSA